jgi:hypothetical protein
MTFQELLLDYTHGVLIHTTYVVLEDVVLVVMTRSRTLLSILEKPKDRNVPV